MTRCQVSQKARRAALINGDEARLLLGVNGRRGYALVDLAYKHLEGMNWHLDDRGYPSAHVYIDGRRTKLRLHQAIMGKAPSGMVIDHINRNKLDNRLANLRIVTSSVNNFNKGPYKRKAESLAAKCLRGHPFNGDNVYVRPDNGRRQCKECNRIRHRKSFRDRTTRAV